VAIRTGQRLGPYEIPSAIGAVGRREVCRAPDSHRNPDLVPKVLPQTVATDPDCMARFKGEARVLGLIEPFSLSWREWPEPCGISKARAPFIAIDRMLGPSSIGHYPARKEDKTMKRQTSSPMKHARPDAPNDRCPSRREILGTLAAVGTGMVLAPSASVGQTVGPRSSSSAENESGAQTSSKRVRRPERYDDSLIFERKPFTWPGARPWQCGSSLTSKPGASTLRLE
jgi:hypothetical protein